MTLYFMKKLFHSYGMLVAQFLPEYIVPLQTTPSSLIKKFFLNMKNRFCGFYGTSIKGYPKRQSFRSWWDPINDTLRSTIGFVTRKLLKCNI